jgi:hypothetical protein
MVHTVVLTRTTARDAFGEICAASASYVLSCAVCFLACEAGLRLFFPGFFVIRVNYIFEMQERQDLVDL